ncbi:MAG: altronate dehydratase family protein [Verrucomicrobiota bacterium]
MLGRQTKALKTDSSDNVAVALVDLRSGDTVEVDGQPVVLVDNVKHKHKFACAPLPAGTHARMYGVTVGEVLSDIPLGGVLTTENLKHLSDSFAIEPTDFQWTAPDVAQWKEATFDGYVRRDGSVGTANYWIIVPLVFCENRNIDVIERALNKALGFDRVSRYEQFACEIAVAHANDRSDQVHSLKISDNTIDPGISFPNIDGVRCLTHTGGCGGTREDANNLCGLLAGYINHPNVAGATVLSLGCQNAQVRILQDELNKRNPSFDRPLLIYQQQDYRSETAMIEDAIRDTYLGIAEAGKLERSPAPLSKLSIGVECGASDGFSGISANPLIGQIADYGVALGGKIILSEFPELCGVEQEFVNRCTDDESARRFIEIMRSYGARAEAAGSGFSMNPSPGNIKDGLITDAIKSAGAGRKGGTSPVVDVLDYPETATKAGLSLLCTPGNDVESTTAMVGAGNNLILFSTGLGTPTGNPIAPVIKISSNHAVAIRHSDMIDFDAGDIVEGKSTVEEMAHKLMSQIIDVASGHLKTKAMKLGQHDFQPWKRGPSL